MASATAEALRLSRGRAVPPANFHVTLAFLGSVAAERIAALVAVAAAIRAADPGHSLRLVFDRIEYWKKAELLCVVARAEPHIAAFADRLREQLASACFAPDLKPFRAHVTLARKVPPPSASSSSRTWLYSHLEMAPLEWTFTRFALFESRTLPTGPLYSVIESWPLVKRERAAS